MDISNLISQGTLAVGILVALTNVITEVAKLNVSALRNSNYINIFATIVAIVLTVASGVAYSQINEIALTWYHYIALVIVGFMVALASMTNFDKLLSYFENLKGDN